MKQMILAGILAAQLGVISAHAADPEYVVRGNVTTPPMVNATNFINYGQFGPLFSTYPFETSSTWNYTNFGSMIASPGFRLEHVDPNTGRRGLAANFVNRNPGFVQVQDPASDPFLPCFRSLVGESRLHISATNIITGAGVPLLGIGLSAGANGEIRLVGNNVDLSYSGLGISPVWQTPYGSGRTTPSFAPDIAIFDLYWAQTNFIDNVYGINTAGLWDGFLANSPGVTLPPFTAPGFTLSAPLADAYTNWVNFYRITLTNVSGDISNVQPSNVTITNILVASNMFKGAVFVSTPPQFSAQILFSGSQQPRNFFNTHNLLIETVLTNTLTESFDLASLRIEDMLASDTRIRGYTVNFVGCDAVTAKPRNYVVDRVRDLFGDFPGNFGYPDPEFFLSSGLILSYPDQIFPDAVTNSFIEAGDVSGYGVFPDNIVTRPPMGPFGVGVAGGNETNYTGRVRVNAGNLNLENTRIRAEGLIQIEADHVVSTKGTVIDCEQIDLNLSSTNGNLNVDNLIPTTVNRLRGPILIWSAVWTNSTTVVFTNNFTLTNLPVFNPPGSTNVVGTNLVAIPTPLTNFCTVGYAVTMVDATLLQTDLPVRTFTIATHSRDTVINDDLTVYRDFLVDGRSLTLNNPLSIPGTYPPDPLTGTVPPETPLSDWSKTVAPSLIYLTNNARFQVANAMHFGDDRTVPYAAIVNNGNMSAATISFNSSYLLNSGDIASSGDLRFAGSVAKMENGTTASGTVTRFDVATAKFNGYQLSASGPLILNVADALSDAEGNSPNQLTLNDGVQMLRKPKTGALLRTAMVSQAPSVPGAKINHVWAADDYGPTPAGFVDNAAVGSLVLSSSSSHPLFRFAGAGNHNAMYVDVLDLSNLTDITNQVSISPNLVIYYAALKIGFTPPLNKDGIQQQPEEYLNGAFGGRLRWVSTFAGPGSSVPVLLTNVANGPITFYANGALVGSRIIDSDGDGVPNHDDGIAPNGDKFTVAKLGGAVSGNGSVVPSVYGQYLIVGQTYTLIAKAKDGSDFSGWSGSVSGVDPVLSFTMETNSVINATFTYVANSSTYRGLFYEQEAVELGHSGSVTLSTTPSGSCSGSLVMGNKKYSFKGTLSSSGSGTFSIPRSGESTLSLQIQVGDAFATGNITDGDWTATVAAGRSVYNAASNPAPRPGKYTIVFPGNANAAQSVVPHGDGYGSVTLSAAGNIKMSGALGDGTKISQSSSLTEASQWPLYQSLYSGKGQILGWLNFGDFGFQDISGRLSWIKNQDLAAKFYPDGFNVELPATGSTYDPTLAPVTGFSDGIISGTGGNSSGFSSQILFGANNRVTSFGPSKLSLKLNTASGLFSGSATDATTGKALKFNGAIHQKLQEGRGLFPGTNQTGKVWLRE